MDGRLDGSVKYVGRKLSSPPMSLLIGFVLVVP